MNAAQESILKEINELKALLRTEGPFKFRSGLPASRAQMQGRIRCLARSLVNYDDRAFEMKKLINRPTDNAGRSRSCAFGRWEQDDES